MTFIDGTSTHEILAYEPPTDEQLRSVAIALIGRALTPGLITDTERVVAHDIAQALGIIPTLSPRYRDPVTGAWTKR